MIFDKEGLFSDAQAITASAASTNVIDNKVARDIGKGEDIPLRIQVVEAFNNLTSLDVALQIDDNEAFSSATTVITTNVLLADLVAGKVIPPCEIPRGTKERYMRLYYTVNGSAPTTGKITAGTIAGEQDTFHQ